MADEDIFSNADIDALHILPLSLVPLHTPGLRKTRMLKNSRLEGVVEIYKDDGIGSGQVPPAQVPTAFSIEDGCDDIAVLTRLGRLPSYDVYSLRVSLRDFGVAVEDAATLQLSKEAQDLLTPYMREFTRPLVKIVYGSEAGDGAGVNDIIKLFADPDVETARNNLRNIAGKLGVKLDALPSFLADYGDVYLSLAYYQRNLDDIQPHLATFLQSMQQVRDEAKNTGDAGGPLRACHRVEQRLKRANNEIDGVMELFRIRTENMWSDMSQEKFDRMRDLINAHQTAIGATLCTIAVKLKAWATRFPRPKTAPLTGKVNFVVSDMLPGIGNIQSIDT